MLAPARPFARDAAGEVLALAQRLHREVAERTGYGEQHQVRDQPHHGLAGARPVPPVAALRAEEQGGAIALDARHNAKAVAAEAVADAQQFLAGGFPFEVIERARGIQLRPVVHARREAAQGAPARIADAAVVEGEDGKAGLRQVRGEFRVIAALDAGGGVQQHGAAAGLSGAEQGGAQGKAVARGNVDRRGHFRFGIGRGRPLRSIATKVSVASVTLTTFASARPRSA